MNFLAQTFANINFFNPFSDVQNLMQTGTEEDAIKLPSTESVWIVDAGTMDNGMIDDEGLIGVKAVVHIVEPNDALSYSIKVLMERFEYVIKETCVDVAYRVIIGACNHPGTMMCPITLQPGRPKLIYFISSGFHNSIKRQLRDNLGIESKVASQKLIAEFNQIMAASGMTARCMEDSHITSSDGDSTLQSTIRGLQNLSQSTDLSETPDPNLRYWLPSEEEREHIKCIPFHWFVKPVDEESRISQCWGWRSNFENALQLGNCDKLRTFLTGHSSDDIKDLCYQRLFLRKAAKLGLIDVCKFLVEECNIHPDENRSIHNKPEWCAFQGTSGNNGMAEGATPLFACCETGNTPIIQYLLSKGANPNLLNDCENYSALRAAIVHCHKDVVLVLIHAGADPYQQMAEGLTSYTLCDKLIETNPPDRQRIYHRIKILLAPDPVTGRPKALSRPLDACALCDAPGCRLRCSCLTASYCNKECQKNDWKAHKISHNSMTTESSHK